MFLNRMFWMFWKCIFPSHPYNVNNNPSLPSPPSPLSETASPASCINPPKSILVLGFYDRDNTGDELFKDAFSLIIGPSAKLTFVSTDDVDVIPEDTDMVIVGGGDVINNYFMTKVVSILDASDAFKGEVYALSVGIPYSSCADKWLQVFDHVFVRNSEDYALARSILGDRNVTQMCDACAYIPMHPRHDNPECGKVRVGIAVSRPFFSAQPDAVSEIARAFARLDHEFHGIEFHLIAFNHHDENTGENDHISCDDLYDALLLRRVVDVCLHDDAADRNPERSVDLVRSMDVVVCMRYHSAVLSLMSPTAKTIIVECSSKLSKLAKDYAVTSVDVKMMRGLSSRLFLAMRDKIRDSSTQACIEPSVDVTTVIRAIIFGESKRKRKDLLVLPDLADLKIDDYDREFQKRLKIIQNTHFTSNNIRDARLISMIFTDTVLHSCVWGLSENITKPDFDLVESAKYVWGDRVNKANALKALKPIYLPGGGWGAATKRTYVNLRCHSLLATSYHRSGWAYVESGMQSLSAKRFGRNKTRLILDTYADETFLWACDANVRTGVLPYRSPWAAFIHHTFDVANFPHDLNSMFSEKAFLDSIPSCVCLITLTTYLAGQIRAALDSLPGGIGLNVKVATLTHPTELGNLPEFSIDAFMKSKRQIIQVGAWLRDEASFCAFSLGDNPLGLSKAILRTHAVQKKKCNPGASGFASGFEFQADPTCDVEEIGYLTACEYDALLTSSIVLLCLFDASAVNTVIECIVRNTPLIINRHPAVAEALGTDYPGFYEKGSSIEIDEELVRKCHDHLSNIDTTPYRLDTFLTSLDNLFSLGLLRSP